ncbi:MAG TPA: hypothetical protein VFY67_05305 [Pyrinomonadaceae bacterium]|nr:hypothetical protein [Pyrinomonadaceae bacterium]
MPLSIRQLRLSLIWMKSLSPATPVASLENPETFKTAFEKAKDAKSNSPWLPPWKLGREQSYWEYYLYKYKPTPKRVAANSITRHTAWENLLPLRLRALAKLKAAKEVEWLTRLPVYIEAYCYAHAVAAIIHLTIRDDKGIPVEELVDKTVRLRLEKWLEGKWSTGDTFSKLSLPDVAVKALDHVAAIGFASDKTEWLLDDYASPFSIATVIDASGSDLFGKYEELKEPAYGSFVRALNGLCNGSPNWRLQDISGSDLLLKKKSALLPPGDPPPPGHVLRATESGRAVWFPKYFAEHFQGQESDRPVLGSYHRRLTLSSLQVESLITFLQRNQGFFKSGKMNADLDARMRWACQILGKLYGGRGTYRSYSANEQIDTRASFINSIRKGFKMKELHRAGSVTGA